MGLSAVSSMKCACSMPCWACGSGASGSACALAASSFNLKHVSPTQCHANRLFAFDSVSQKPSRTSSPPPPTNVMRVNLPFSSTEGSPGQSLESKGLNKFRRGFECTRTNNEPSLRQLSSELAAILLSAPWLLNACKSRFLTRIHHLFPNFVKGYFSHSCTPDSYRLCQRLPFPNLYSTVHLQLTRSR